MERRSLYVKMDELIEAMETHVPGAGGQRPFCFDLQTGEVVLSLEDEDAEVDHVESERFVEIPETDAQDDYRAMEEFAGSIDEDDVRAGAQRAIQGKGAFGRFRDLLRGYPDLLARWENQKQQRTAAEAVAWLRDLGIEPQYELREIPMVQPAGRPEAQTGQPRVGLFDMLLLGAPDGKTELVEGRVARAFRARDPGHARGVFRRLARELAEHHGVAWRNRFIEGSDRYSIGRCSLSVEGRTVHLEVEVSPEIWALFSR